MMELFIGSIILLSLASMWGLKKESDKIWIRLNAIERQAKMAITAEDLEDAQVALQVYVSENCWHRVHTAEARKIYSYIQGRLQEKYLTK